MLAKCGIKPYRILACGGDGTAGWVFQSIDDLKLEYRPPLAHLPLGTANDLSRVTGMGPKYSGEDLLPIVKGVIKSDVVQFDRWTLDMELDGVKQETKYFNNYFSVGLDALIALEVCFAF
jgi:diacylglycerol kinase (ATP)